MPRGKRYTAAEKGKIVKFVKEYDAEHKRGGMNRAVKKFGVSFLTVKGWVADLGGTAKKAVKGKAAQKPAAPAPKAKPGRKPEQKPAQAQAPATVPVEPIAGYVSRIYQYSEQLAQLQAKLDKEKKLLAQALGL